MIEACDKLAKQISKKTGKLCHWSRESWIFDSGREDIDFVVSYVGGSFRFNTIEDLHKQMELIVNAK